MSLEVKAVTKNNANPLRAYLPLEVMQRRMIGTGDLIKIKQQDQVNKRKENQINDILT